MARDTTLCRQQKTALSCLSIHQRRENLLCGVYGVVKLAGRILSVDGIFCVAPEDDGHEHQDDQRACQQRRPRTICNAHFRTDFILPPRTGASPRVVRQVQTKHVMLA